jgi:argininosuccinate synthase
MAAAKKASAKPVAKVKAGTVKTGSAAKTVKAAVKTADTKKEKVVLAYSGGLDTTVIIPWLKENYNYDVIAVCINVGQDSELKNLEQRAKIHRCFQAV